MSHAGFAQPSQQPPVPTSSQGVKPSSSEDAPGPSPESLDRIRELLSGPAPVQESLDRGRPTFRVKIEERDRFQELLRALAFAEQTKPLPPPPGGVYGAEHLRIARSALGRERMEPYATFSGPEMITLAIEGFIAKYLGGQALSALSDAEQARAKAAAREEAARAVRLYCAAQPGYGAGIPICSDLP